MPLSICIGDQGNEWKKAEVTIPRVPDGNYYILLFKGTAGGLTSEMAVDDILVTTGSCRVTPDPINPGRVRSFPPKPTRCNSAIIVHENRL